MERADNPAPTAGLRRRQALAALLAGAVPLLCRAGGTTRVAAAWATEDGRQWAGAFDLDLGAGQVRVAWQQQLPGRAHGLLPLPDGDLLVLAVRPGRWLMRLAADGRVRRTHRLDEAGEPHTLGGHALWVGGRVCTTETDPVSGCGAIGVRDPDTLARVGGFDSGGIEPHDLLADGEGCLLVAHGGIRRGEGDRKLDLDRMASSLTRLDPLRGLVLAQWRVADARLSLRHLARAGALVGVAMQAEHDDPAERQRAPVLAVLDGEQLHVPDGAPPMAGYGADITASGDGGFAVSGSRVGRVLRWRADRGFDTVAELRQAYALAASPDGGVLVAAERGIGHWHSRGSVALLRWPAAVALDNHWRAL